MYFDGKPVLFVTTIAGIDEYRGKDADRVAQALEHAFLSYAEQTTPTATSKGGNVTYIMRHIVKTYYVPGVEEDGV